jgi:predicted enzyme related to lactoylglutathione lyase
MVSFQAILGHMKRLDALMHIKSTNIILYCKKWEEMVAFYQGALQLSITTSTEWFVEFKLTRTARLSIADESRTSIKSGSGKGITIGLQVADVMTTRARLKDAGLNPTEVKEVWGAKAFYIFDPEGNRIEFWSGRARS